MNAPSQELATKWGVLYASTADGEAARFSTSDPNGGRPEQRLHLNGVEYAFKIGLQRGEAPRGPESYWPLDDTWYVDVDEALHSLWRPDGGEVTTNARMRVRDGLLPEVARWLGSAAGQSLLEEGRAHQRADQQRLADDASLVLVGAQARVDLLQIRLDRGAVLAPADEQFLHDIHDHVQRALVPADRVLSPPPPVPADNPPEVPGL